MPKLSQQHYRTKNGIEKINCYHINISKEVVKKSGIDDNDEVKVYAKHGKIIIEKGK